MSNLSDFTITSTVSVTKTLYDANSILVANEDDTPSALIIGEQTILGRLTASGIDDLSATQVRTLLNVADGANAYVHPNHTGDVTSTGDGATVAVQASGAWAFPGDITVVPAEGNNNWNPTGLSTASIIRVNVPLPNISTSITGIAGGSDGRILILFNVSALTFTLYHNSSSSSAENRFYLPETSIDIEAYKSIVLCYDSTSLRWRPIGNSGNSGNSTLSSVAKSSNYTILDNDGYTTIFISGNTQITLSAASTKRLLKFVKTDSGGTVATIVRAGTNTIEGETTITLNSQYDSVTLESDGTATWYSF